MIADGFADLVKLEMVANKLAHESPLTVQQS